MRVQWVRLFSIASVSAGFVLLSFCSSSKAQQTLNRNEARKQCNSYDANERLTGCTVVINAKGFGSRFEVATAYDGRCWAFNDLQQYERGLADCKAAVSLAPQYYYGHLNIANSLIGLGQISNGIAEFTKAITLKPSLPHAYWGRGRAFASLGNKDLARKDFEYLLSIQPTNEEVREAIAALDSPPPTQEVRPAPTAPNPAPAPKGDTAASSGTGFYVSVSGHVLTNYHVIDGCQTASIFRSGFSPIGARIVAADTKNDLALLKSDSSIKPIPPLRTGARVGETVYAYGFPLTGLLSSSGNFTVGTVTSVAGLGDDSRIMQVSTPVQPGNSGGPLLDKFGNVVGIIVSKLNAIILAQVTQDMAQNVNFAIKASIAENFLEVNNISTSAALMREPLEATEIADRAREFTVRISCQSGR
jgi:S1-C subfamily serine protease